MKKIIVIILTVFIAGTFNLMAQSDEVLTNAKVIDLYNKGLSTTIIVNKIKASKNSFDVSTDALIALKDKKVPDDIVNAMVEASSKKEAVVGDVNDPMANHESGIYYDKKKGGADEMIILDPTLCSSTSSGSNMGYGWGGSIKRKAVIDGGMARIQIEESKPVFYFYFQKTSGDLGNTSAWNNQSTSPSEFVLIKMVDKQKNREFVIGSSNAYSGTSNGFDKKQKVEFNFEKVKPGVYKVTPKAPLEGAEYGFVYAGGTQGISKVYDFGVK